MTGFSRAEGEICDLAWIWELRSVNGKGLDARVRLPAGYEAVEQDAKAKIQGAFTRGNVSASLSLSRAPGVASHRVNWDMLDLVAEAAQTVCSKYPSVAPPSADGLFNVKGVVESRDDNLGTAGPSDVAKALLASFGQAIDALQAARRDEGRRLTAVIGDQIETIDGLRQDANQVVSDQRDALRARTREAVEQLMAAAVGLDGDRLEQEVAVIYAKADVREELDRLEAHVEQARAFLASADAVGRRFDFLCQELNREANTLCSKASLPALSRIGLDLKIGIDQLREQVQNIE